MIRDPLPFLPYPPLGQHGVIGDRRTAALVAADGTLNWLCLPHYDGPPLFAALLDARAGGFWRAGPARPVFGQQRYVENSAVLRTRWTTADWELELTDAMAWPWDNRAGDEGGGDGRVMLRRLRCLRGLAPVAVAILPRDDFAAPPRIARTPDGATFTLRERPLTIWTSRPAAIEPDRIDVSAALQPGDELWSVLAWGEEQPRPWTPQRATALLEETDRFWRAWVGALNFPAATGHRLRRSAITVHLLSYAPTGSPVAAPTTSLPERLGGDRNWDYRYAWVRDAALSVAALARCGELTAARRYMDCLTSYESSTDSPLQVVYGVDGALDLPEHKRWDLAGYAGSRPVRIGNRACAQRQLDSLGFFNDCAFTYLDSGGEWRDEHWDMVHRAADYTLAHWRQPDSGIWELVEEAHYVSGKVMSWVALERAATIACRLGHEKAAAPWRAALAEIHAEVMDRGWDETRQTFRQRYDGDNLDASALLIPIVGFLPVDHPRVAATVDRIVAELTVDGFVHRFFPDPAEPPLAHFEGAFLPCTFWLATVFAMAGRHDEAEAILAKADAIAGELGLFAEQVDVRSRAFLGNTPLLFSHAEYARAVLAIHETASRQDSESVSRRGRGRANSQ